VEDLSATNYKIFPNPVRDVLTITVQGNELDTIYIYNGVGSLINSLNPTGSIVTIDMTDFSAGYYIVRIGQVNTTIVKL
jgi:hypothetical protein